jgi:hypothetical protein
MWRRSPRAKDVSTNESFDVFRIVSFALLSTAESLGDSAILT